MGKSQLSAADASNSEQVTRDSSSMSSPTESPVRSPTPSDSRNFLVPGSPLGRTFSAAGEPPSPSPHHSQPIALSGDCQPVPPIDIPEGELRAVNQVTVAFAIDISGSTAGSIIRQEKDAIMSVTSTFDSTSLRHQCTVLPWSHKSHSPLKIDEIEEINSGGGTDPSVLLENPVFRSQLQRSNLWFLLTDGEIYKPVITKFANAIPEARIHGTACVIILFGYSRSSPLECNVSVGMSVFAVAPHCIFLFHDVRSAKVYILQAKGCFSSLLPETERFTSFGTETRWDELACITYKSLAQVRIASLSPISLLASKRRALRPEQSERRTSPINHRHTSGRAEREHQSQLRYGNSTYPRAARSSKPKQHARNLLFMPGFEGTRILSDNDFFSPNYDTCALCGEHKSIQTLLLSTNRNGDDETPDLPKANRKARHKYPLVLGSYPETDVILPFMTCDACAFVLLEVGELPNGDRVTAALPMVSLYNEVNRSKWLELLSSAYEHRFHERIVFLVFLSSLCSALEDLTTNDEPGSSSLIRVLESCCMTLCQLPGISTIAGFTPVGSPIANMVDDTMPFATTIGVAFNRQATPGLELPCLTYPIEGFLAIVRLASLTEDIEGYSIESMVWKKLLYHMTGQHCVLQKQQGAMEADKTLRSVIYSENVVQPDGIDGGKEPVPILSFSISALSDTHLLQPSSEIIDQFERMEQYFLPIKDTTKYHAAMAVFLHLLSASVVDSARILDASDFFLHLRYSQDISTLFL
ncbi:hypothetical protein PFICI_10926 [Pestalotiopsis fici W106-1]|uniref:Uncharacterized protein n=1 Tax=Pestalotiopsis fici (strain W106-1 / CGMCC3.15140) TaxID=1229662 RepID=W3WV70_PESFW|nr:uncharacterized protein PFICI_10926 [Pestalotiopsis fici W106-1]ETS77052.1 hypothetical protein PFICI_10926 [Pestalotiopsis fici W106-1]